MQILKQELKKDENKILALKQLEAEIFKLRKSMFVSDFQLFDLLHKYHQQRIKYGFNSSPVVFEKRLGKKLDKGLNYFSQLFALFRLYNKEVESYLKQTTIDLVKTKTGTKAIGLTIHKAMILATRATKENYLSLLKRCHNEKWGSTQCKELIYKKISSSRTGSILLSYSYLNLRKAVEKLDIANFTLEKRGNILKILNEMETICRKKREEIISLNKKDFDYMNGK